MIYFFCGDTTRPEDTYCRACREAGLDDCEHCDRDIEVNQ